MSAMHLPHLWHKRLLTLLLPLLAATEFVENSAFSFAASQIADDFQAAPLEFSLLLAAFTTGTMLMIVLQQVLTRHWGYRRYLLGALALFAAGSIGSTLSGSWLELVCARAVEGMGAGALFTSSRILVVHLFAREERPAALRTYIGTLFGITAIAPLLAAGLSVYGGWHATFLAPLPLAALAFAGVYVLLPPGVGHQDKPVTWSMSPILLFSAAAFLMQISLAEARHEVHPNTTELLLLALAGGALLWRFVARQRHHAEPLLRWHGLRHPGYLLGMALYGLYYLVSNANNFLFPLLTEDVLELPLFTIGVLGTFSAGVTWLTALLYLRWAKHVVHKRWLMVLGSLSLMLSCIWLAHTPAHASAHHVLPALAFKGVFSVLLVLPLAGFTFRELDDERFGSGYQSKNLLRQWAISMGTALSAMEVARLQNVYANGLNATYTSPGNLQHVAGHMAVSHMYQLLAAACGVLVAILLGQKKLH